MRQPHFAWPILVLALAGDAIGAPLWDDCKRTLSLEAALHWRHGGAVHLSTQYPAGQEGPALTLLHSNGEFFLLHDEHSRPKGGGSRESIAARLTLERDGDSASGLPAIEGVALAPSSDGPRFLVLTDEGKVVYFAPVIDGPIPAGEEVPPALARTRFAGVEIISSWPHGGRATEVGFVPEPPLPSPRLSRGDAAALGWVFIHTTTGTVWKSELKEVRPARGTASARLGPWEIAARDVRGTMAPLSASALVFVDPIGNLYLVQDGRPDWQTNLGLFPDRVAAALLPAELTESERIETRLFVLVSGSGRRGSSATRLVLWDGRFPRLTPLPMPSGARCVAPALALGRAATEAECADEARPLFGFPLGAFTRWEARVLSLERRGRSPRLRLFGVGEDGRAWIEPRWIGWQPAAPGSLGVHWAPRPIRADEAGLTVDGLGRFKEDVPAPVRLRIAQLARRRVGLRSLLASSWSRQRSDDPSLDRLISRLRQAGVNDLDRFVLAVELSMAPDAENEERLRRSEMPRIESERLEAFSRSLVLPAEQVLQSIGPPLGVSTLARGQIAAPASPSFSTASVSDATREAREAPAPQVVKWAWERVAAWYGVPGAADAFWEFYRDYAARNARAARRSWLSFLSEALLRIDPTRALRCRRELDAFLVQNAIAEDDLD